MGYDIDKILQMGQSTEQEVSTEPHQEHHILQLPPGDLIDFPKELHKFKPASAKRMEELEQSIRVNGIINPLILRQLPDGKYQIIAGHNRRTAAMNIGYKTVRCIVMDLPDDNDALRVLIADNLLNRDLLPSERGWGYRQEMEIRNRQGQRSDLTSDPLGPKLDDKLTSRHNGTKFRTDEMIAADVSKSARQIQRYIRLTYLILPLLNLVDEGKIGLVVGEQLSYLSRRSQEVVYGFCYAVDPMKKLKESQARELRTVEIDPDRIVDEDFLEELTSKKQKVRFRTLKLEMSQLRDYFPAGTPEEVVKKTIDVALAAYFTEKEDS